ncbi:MAG: polyprenyl synthetase family protein [Candidatus Hydrothermarchaeaceae archaeon]
MGQKNLIDEYTEKIEERLSPYLKELSIEGGKYHPYIGEIYDSLGEFILRKGKRLASSSTLMIYRGYTGELDEEILKVGLGVELYRHSILIHDDMIDRDKYRRGGKTFHEIFGRSKRYGNGISLFSGNLLFSLALDSILNSGFEIKKIKEVMDLFAGDYRDVNESQILDLYFEHKMPDEEEWHVMAGKRASSLFHATILTGAILGGAPNRDLRLLKEASRSIGYSFDIQDDIIGSFASEEEYGRPPGGDLAYGKKPLHMVYALKMAKEKEVREIENAIGKKERAEQVKEIVRKSGALKRAKEKSKEHAKRASELLLQTGLDKKTKDSLTSYIDYVAGSLDWYR